MKLWLDGQCFQSPSRYRGIGRYAHELINAITENNPEIELSISFNAHMIDEALVARERVLPWIKPENIHIWHGVADGGEAVLGHTSHRKISDVALAHHVACLQPDMALSLSLFEGQADKLSPFFPPTSFDIPAAAIFYDAIPYRLPELYLKSVRERETYRRRLKGLRNFDLLLSISEYALREVNDLVPGVQARNISAGLGAEFKQLLQATKGDDLPLKLRAGEPSLLYVGGLDQRKNLVRAVKAIDQLPSALRNKLQFVLVGHLDPPSLQDVQFAWDNAGLPRENFQPFGYASDENLVAIYRQVDLVIQPSLLEGFGLTVLEAMHCGTPVIAADAGAVSEVVGENALLFDPENVTEIAARIEWALTAPEEVASFRATALERAKGFTWDTTAKRAVGAMLETITASHDLNGATKNDLQQIRQDTLIAAKKTGYGADEIAITLSAAEVPVRAEPRLFVDVTATARVDYKTGIQRVVRKIATDLPTVSAAVERTGPVYIGCNKPRGFFPVDFSDDLDARDWDNRSEERVRFCASDTILMLDSSWEFHESYLQVLKSARLMGAEVITVLYDLVPLRASAFCDAGMPIMFSAWLKSALAYSTGFVCISKAIADELLVLLEAIEFPRPLNIGYWHLGADFGSSDETGSVGAKPRDKAARPMFLAVGTLEPRKGHEVILDAFEQLWEQGLDVELVFVGKRGWGTEHTVSRIQESSELGQRLRWHWDVSDVELQELYANCSGLIAASYAEGFGLPIVEASHLGKPVIASDIPVFKEVSGDVGSVDFFEVGDPNSLSEAVQRFLKAKPGSAAQTKQEWMTWRESASQLDDVVRGGNWYRRYEPVAGVGDAGASPIGKLTMAAAVTDDREAYTFDLELVQRPAFSQQTGGFRIIVKVTNTSDYVWSSQSDMDAETGVELGYVTLEQAGDFTDGEMNRTKIPFVIAPGEFQYLPVDVPLSALQSDVTEIRIGLVQPGVGWWGLPLNVELSVPAT